MKKYKPKKYTLRDTIGMIKAIKQKGECTGINELQCGTCPLKHPIENCIDITKVLRRAQARIKNVSAELYLKATFKLMDTLL
ncbi:MAG TPA: hypothetical protein P5136_01525 [Methanofastidiosum sp.]|nr:hypothetical protein [Methanofastidiosum sp.]